MDSSIGGERSDQEKQKHLLARGLEERQNFKELLTESVGRVHFS